MDFVWPKHAPLQITRYALRLVLPASGSSAGGHAAGKTAAPVSRSPVALVVNMLDLGTEARRCSPYWF